MGVQVPVQVPAFSSTALIPRSRIAGPYSHSMGCGFGEKHVVSLAKRSEGRSAGGLWERSLLFIKTAFHRELLELGSLESLNSDEKTITS